MNPYTGPVPSTDETGKNVAQGHDPSVESLVDPLDDVDASVNPAASRREYQRLLKLTRQPWWAFFPRRSPYRVAMLVLMLVGIGVLQARSGDVAVTLEKYLGAVLNPTVPAPQPTPQCAWVTTARSFGFSCRHQR